MKAELKLKTLTAAEIAKVCGGVLETFGNGPAAPVTNIVYDSREVTEGSLFCAVKGENTDGHKYISTAVKSGATVVLAESVPEDAGKAGSYTAVIVKNTVEALGILAGYYRGFSRAKIIGVTGSVGKTTTKEFIASVCSQQFCTLKTEGNHNNEIGMPMTLFSLAPEHEVAVLEMGMSAFGEISFMTKLARPAIGVITNIGSAHIANLGSRENICKAKLEIAEGIPDDGILILNGDEPLLADKKNTIGLDVRYLGMYSKNADCKALNVRCDATETVFDILDGDKILVNVAVSALGKHNVYNALVAYYAGTLLGIDETKIRKGLIEFKNTGMRQNVYDVGDIKVIEDCYNASPESMRAALDVLVSQGQKTSLVPCALLGDMLELGDSSRLLHEQIGQYAAQVGVKKLFCYGAMAETVAEAAIKKGVRAQDVYVCEDINAPEVMAKMIAKACEKGDIILVKASRGVAAERVIEAMKKDNTKKA